MGIKEDIKEIKQQIGLTSKSHTKGKPKQYEEPEEVEEE